MPKNDEITTKFKVDISDLKSGISEANQQIKLANAEFKAATAGMDDWAKSADGIRAKLSQLESVLSAQKSKLEAYNTELERQKDAYDENGKRAAELRAKLEDLTKNGVSKTSDEYKKYESALAACEAEQEKNKKAVDRLSITVLDQQAAVGKTQAEIGKYNGALDELEKESGEAEKSADELGDSLDEAGDSAEEAGKDAEKSGEGWNKLGDIISSVAKLAVEALAAATAAVVSFAKESVNVGSAFDASMSQVAAVSGAAEEEFDALREKALEMGSKTKFSASEAADAMNYMAMAGWKTEDMISGIEGIMNLAAASGESLGATSDIVTDALTAFGLTAEDSAHFADILAAASSNANTNVSMMGETFKYAAPIAGALGFSAEDTAEAIGLMANAGIKASMAGTSLRTIMTALSGEVSFTGSQIGQVDIATKNADGSMRELTDILADCREVFSGLTESEAAFAAESVFGKNAMSGFLALMNAAPSDVEKLQKAIANCSAETEEYSGAAEQMAKVMQDNLAGDITIFKSALEGAQITLSDVLTPALREFVQFGTESVASLADAFKEGGLSGAMDALGGILSEGLAMVIESLPEFIDAGMQLLEALGEGLVDNLPVITKAALDVVLMLSEKLIEATPELITVGVEILLALIDGFTQAIPTLAEKVVEVVPTVVTALVGAIPDLLKGAIEFFLAIVQAIPEIIPALIEALPEIITAISEALVEGIPMLIEGSIQLLMAIIDAIPVIVTALTENLPQIIEAIVTTLVDNIPVLLEGAVTLFMALVEAIPVIVEELIKALPQIVDALMEFLTGPALDLFTELWEGIKAVFKNLGQWFSIKFKNAWEGIQAAWSAVGQWFADLWESIKEIFSGIGDWFGEKFDAAWQTIKGAWSGVELWFSDLWEGIKEIFSGVGDWFGETFEKVGSAIKAPLNAVIRAMNTVIDGLNTISIDVPDWVPLLGGKTFGFNLSKIPELAQGGVLGRGQTGFLEGNGAEAVVPLDQNKFWIREVVEEMLGQMKAAEAAGEITSIGGSRDYNFTQIINAPQAPSRIEIYRQTRNLLSYARATAAGGV